MKYKIVRCHFRHWDFKPVINDELTLEQVQEHCNDPESSSRKCTGKEALEYTTLHGPWFDVYEEM